MGLLFLSSNQFEFLALNYSTLPFIHSFQICTSQKSTKCVWIKENSTLELQWRNPLVHVTYMKSSTLKCHIKCAYHFCLMKTFFPPLRIMKAFMLSLSSGTIILGAIMELHHLERIQDRPQLIAKEIQQTIHRHSHSYILYGNLCSLCEVALQSLVHLHPIFKGSTTMCRSSMDGAITSKPFSNHFWIVAESYFTLLWIVTSVNIRSFTSSEIG